MLINKNHPFAVEAHFDNSLVLTFAVPKEELEAMIPNTLTLDTFQDSFGFVAAAFVQTKNLRPKGFPTILGKNFLLAGYRIFVKYKSKKGGWKRGLMILKSETDKRIMTFFGNLFTRYHYSMREMKMISNTDNIQIQSNDNQLFVKSKVANNPQLPENSPFENWKEARRFAGPMPYTFSWNAAEQKMVIVKGKRKNWQPNPIEIGDYNIPFLEQLHFSKAVLANAFFVQNIDYEWTKGLIENHLS